MRWWMIGMTALAFTSGCRLHDYLADNTVCVTTTLTDMNYRQILNNVALFICNPSAIPTFAVINAGTVTGDDLKSVSGSARYTPTVTFDQQPGGSPILVLEGGPTCTRELTENWSMSPVVDADNLRRMRCAFQLVVAGDSDECGKCVERLSHFYPAAAADLDCYIPRGWFHVGKKKEMPKDACYCGHYCDTYVWVTQEGREGLSRFTLTVLDLATGKIQIPQKTVLRTFKPDGKLESTQETTVEVDHHALESLKHGALYPDRARDTGGNGINPGMFFQPRQ